MNRLAILDICAAEIGTTEIIGKDHNPRVLEYHQATNLRASTDETPWCAAFVNWVLMQAGYRGTRSAAARSFLNWGIAADQASMGCIVVFRRGTKAWQGHVGFYLGKDQHGNIQCLGGNQSNQVCLASYPAEDVLGYRIAD